MFIFCIIFLTYFVLYSFANVPYKKFDAHLHYLDFNQLTDGIDSLITEMDNANVYSAIIFGMPMTKIYTSSDPIRPAYYLDTDSPAMYDSSSDHLLAMDLQLFAETNPEKAKRLKYFICATNPHDINTGRLLEQTIDRFPPGFVKGIGEIMSRHDDLTFFTLGEPLEQMHQE